MRVSSPSSSNARASTLPASANVCVAVGTLALLTAIVILVAGGFVVDAGPLHVSLRRWPRPAAVALIAWLAAAWTSRSLTTALAALTAWTERHAQAAAIVLAASAAACGIAFGTYAASGSDAGGYIGAAELFASGRTSFDEPLARRVNWPGATAAFAPLGFRPEGAPGRIVPTYPPGLSLLMIPARALFGDTGSYVIVPLLGALAVLATFVLGRRLSGSIAGLIAAAFMATSPVFLFQIVQPMSDVPATALWALALALAWNGSPQRASLAGLLAGLALVIRPNLLPLLLPLAAVVTWSSGAPTRFRQAARLAALAAGLAPPAVALALLQWRMYGSPLASGYGASAFRDFFSLSNVPQNIVDYTRRIAIGETPAIVVSVLALAAIAVLRPKHPSRQPSRTPLLLAATFVATVVLCYLPYGIFPDWWYLRFLLPAFPALFALIGVAVDVALARIPVSARGLTLLVTLTLVSAFNTVEARRQQVFVLRDGEARYQIAGQYLAAMLWSDAVIVTSQESASARYYTHLPILRWDLLPVDLDRAVADLRALGRRPILLVEDWEHRDLAAKFPASSVARLDWAPIADFGDPVRVRLFDPERRGSIVKTDRVH